ncbi:M23 family metallopeptidase [candidate division TA06 bacterium]|nr:M23 family metallopeptidase [candidate division TA06 bacterium]
MKDYKDYLSIPIRRISSSPRWKKIGAIKWAALLFLLIPLLFHPWRKEKGNPSPLPEDSQSRQESKEKSKRVIQGTLRRGRTLGGLLVEKEVPRDLSIALLASLGEVLDLKQCLPSDQFILETSPEGEFWRFEYRSGPKKIYIIEPEGEGLRSFQKKIDVEQKLFRFEGVIERSLYDAFLHLQVSPVDDLPFDKKVELAYTFADIFSWDIDFHLDVKKGDRFRGLVHKEYIDGEFIGFGPILIAQYDPVPHGEEGHTAIYFEEEKGHTDYYYPNGKSLRKVFLRSALQYRRISSYFSRRRYHPILKVNRPHHGVDYAAPRGTEVSTIGDGIVIFAGRKGQYGKLIRIRHPNGYQSGYGHLSRFAKGIRRGVKVKQGQAIGYVGSTGLATGPHLHYEITRNGRYINPLRIKTPAADPVKKKYIPQFERRRGELLALLDGFETLKRVHNLAQLTRMANGRE